MRVRTLATVIAMSGGMVLDSDDLTRLSDERRQWLSMLLPAVREGGAAPGSVRVRDSATAGVRLRVASDAGSVQLG